ncbi:DNA polymerase I [Thermodesulfobacterium hydrogeniphilum]|uniref:DNA polymerase I n=1 Tax=Thermodesulfobacterium hydrogeniphilum TaxID=161156 RepID=UPI00056EB608|nr:DNA polymerase I [Thermodesulfobacterium hydrogeniphilum]
MLKKLIDKNWIFLIDGSSFVYRAYFAIPGYLATTKGFPTKAIFGVTQMILKILKEWDPEYIIWFMDEKEPTFRHIAYENYKATRPGMPEDLKIQIPYIKKIIPALGIPVISCPGYEADDLIATFVHKIIKKLDKSAIIVAGDKDLYSLVSEKVCIYDPVREKLLDKEAFFKKYGFDPTIFPEFRALTGDKSDNIPGVPGVGEKTAKNLIGKFKNLNNLYANISKLTPLKLRENLLKYKEQVLNNVALLTLNFNAPLPSESLEYYERKDPDYNFLKKLFKELEFRKFLTELKIPSAELKARLVEEKIDLEKLKKAEILSILPFKIQGNLFSLTNPEELTVASDEKEAYKLSVEVFKNLKKNTKSEFILHDYKSFLKNYEIFLDFLFDTKLAAYLLNPSLKNYDLDFLLQEHLDINLNSLKASKNELQAIKTCGLYLLGKDLKKKVEEENLTTWLKKVEIPLSEVLFEMEKKGFKIDIEYVRELNQRYQKRLKEIEEKLFEIAGFRFNPRSSREVGVILFEKLKLPMIKKTPKSSLPSTDAEVLEELAPLHPFVKLLLQYRTLYKIKSTYLEAFLKYVSSSDWRLHTEFNQTGTATGRLSSQNPNLQNIPIKGDEGLAIRRVFISEEGYLLCSLDYSQIELRILAHFSEDENLIRAFERGEDIHTFTACEVFGVPLEKVTPEMRRMSKAINFGIAYGMSAYGLSKELRISVKEAEAIINRYFSRYPKIKEYIEKTIEFARENGYVKTLAGRKRYIPEIFSPNKTVKELGQRIAVNTPIQGSASDLIKCAMVALYKELKKQNLKTSIILQIHDELILEVPKEEVEIVKEVAPKIMESPFKYLGFDYKLKVPIKVNMTFGKNWAECK